MEKLCEAAKKGKAVRFDGEEDEEASLPLAVRIKHTTMSVRTAVRRRVEYLEFLKEGAEVGAADDIPIDMEEEGCGAIYKEEDAMVVGTFEQAIKTLQQQCKEETYELYSAEGKTDLLGESGVPESLAKWLFSNNIKVLGPQDGEILNDATIVTPDGPNTYTVKYTSGIEEKKVPAVLIKPYGTAPVRAPEPPTFTEGTHVDVHFQCHREKSRRRLRSQISRLERIIAKTPVPPNPAWLGAPSAAVTDSVRRAAQKSDATRETASAGFKKLLDAWEAARKRHVSQLRPQLGSPDAANELELLVKREARRGDEVQSAVSKFKEKLLAIEAETAKEAVKRLTSVMKGWAAMLDKMVLTEDLQQLPGDELIIPKRKSLKRLRKASRSASGIGVIEGETEGEASSPPKPKVGRAWPSRSWEVLDVSSLASVMAASLPPPPTLTEEEVAAKEKEKEAAAKKKAKGKKSKADPEPAEGDDGEMSEVEMWAKASREEAAFTSYVTTAHRCLVATSKKGLEDFSTRFKGTGEGIREKYEGVEEREERWRGKWKGMVEDLKVEFEK